MDSDLAELSSVASQLEELTKRILSAAERFDDKAREDVAHELYEVERSLRAATRRLARGTTAAAKG